MRADDGLLWSRVMEMVGIGEGQDVIWGWKQHGLNVREKGDCGVEDTLKFPVSATPVEWGQLLMEERPIWGPLKCGVVCAELVQDLLKPWNIPSWFLSFSLSFPPNLCPVTLPHSFRIFHEMSR